MQDVGGKLRAAREGRGISLRQIAATTKISVGTLEAIERNEVSKLPGGVFSRAFVRSYAAEVGLDPDRILDEFLDRFDGDPLLMTPAARIPEEDLQFERGKKRAAIVFVLAIIFMLVVAGIVVLYLLENRPV